MDLDRDLFDAVENGDSEAVQRLLDRGANPNVCVGQPEQRPILVAAQFFPFLIEPLVAAGARLGREHRDTGSGRMMSPLNFAAREDTGESIAVLVRLGVDVREGSDAVFDAARYIDGGDNIRRLVALGADPDVRVGDNRNTPLLMAAFLGQLGCVRALIESGASLDARDWRDNTPLRFAVQQGFVEVLQMLLAAGAMLEPGMEKPEFWSSALQTGRRRLSESMRVIAAHATARSLEAVMSSECSSGAPAIGRPDPGVL